jgi:hypothetical protein
MKKDKTWIQTFTGRRFNYQDPRPEDIDIQDIAHALSYTTRFGGHLPVLYTVAEHSVRVSRITSPENALEALMHDAAEAYLGDVPTPLKRLLPDFQEIEVRVEKAIAEAFGLVYPWPEEVKRNDTVMLITEARDLHDNEPVWIRGYADLEPAESQRLTPAYCWAPPTAKREFIRLYQKLSGYRVLP